MLEVNLFDSNFGNHTCSTAYQTSQHITYAKRQKTYSGITIFTDEWINNEVMPVVKSDIKIGWLREPFCLHPYTYERALDNLQHLDSCLTYHQGFLNLDDKFRFIPYGGIWIPQSQWGIKPKTKNISMLVGNKASTLGHTIRQDIAASQQGSLLVDFYGIYGQPVDYSWQTKYKTLADYKFSIITETCLEDNLFTEWLLDAFILGTVPIYWGCSNLSEFFNTDGVIRFETKVEMNEILAKARILELDVVYDSMLDAVKDNYQLAQEYAVTEDWLYLNVLRNL